MPGSGYALPGLQITSPYCPTLFSVSAESSFAAGCELVLPLVAGGVVTDG